MSKKIFLDDIRLVKDVYPHLQENDFEIVRSYAQFVSIIQQKGLPEFISFDNDLGANEQGIILPDGYACAKWLVYESKIDLRKLEFKVHSANPVAKKQIEGLLNNYIRFLNEGK
ncbi:MAG: cyclic-phosphate processing receiver domain-containing protein [Bacteroidia bacterium]